jgi:hypothetical protein
MAEPHVHQDDLPDFGGDFDDDPCSHCGGEGLCWDGADPLGNCPDDPHRCHACNGSGRAKDQTLW